LLVFSQLLLDRVDSNAGGKLAAYSQSRFNLDVAAETLTDVLADVESQAVSARVHEAVLLVLAAVEGGEDVGQVFVGDTNSLVSDRYFYLVTVLFALFFF